MDGSSAIPLACTEDDVYSGYTSDWCIMYSESTLERCRLQNERIVQEALVQALAPGDLALARTRGWVLAWLRPVLLLDLS